MNTVRHEIRNFILENYYFNQDGPLGDEDSFMDRGIIDSTGILELVSFLEEKYVIEIDSDETMPDNLDSIARLTNFVNVKLSKGLSVSEVGMSIAQGQVL